MSEQLYMYKKTTLPSGRETYVRVPYNPDALAPGESVAVVPRVAPLFKNGEYEGQGSVVLDLLVAKTREAEARRALRDAQEAEAEAKRIRERLGQPEPRDEPSGPPRAFGRVLEP